MTYSLILDSDHLVGDTALDDVLSRAVARAKEDLTAGRLPALSIARKTGDLNAIKEHARRIAIASEAIVILGTGGSSLAGQALVAVQDPYYGHLAPVFMDNIDPHTWVQWQMDNDTKRPTTYIAISKSGSTVETMAQYLLALERMADDGTAASECLTVITEPGSRPLRDDAKDREAVIIDHPADIGGRYSALSVVGLLPAALAWLNLGDIRKGATAVLDDLEANGVESRPARGARALAGQEAAGIGVQVMLPYADRLEPFARWWVQLWGESLGKDGKASTPVAARGATDQHSQLQLWCDGTHRHMVTVIGVKRDIDSGFMRTGEPSLSYLDGRTLQQLLDAEREATVESLRAADVPVRSFHLDRTDAETLGALFAHFMLETILIAHMMGVDPFGQPAVEDGKRRARDGLRAMGT